MRENIGCISILIVILCFIGWCSYYSRNSDKEYREANLQKCSIFCSAHDGLSHLFYRRTNVDFLTSEMHIECVCNNGTVAPIN